MIKKLYQRVFKRLTKQHVGFVEANRERFASLAKVLEEAEKCEGPTKDYSVKESDFVDVVCRCCGHEYRAHKLQNACAYSHVPNYGCYKVEESDEGFRI